MADPRLSERLRQEAELQHELSYFDHSCEEVALLLEDAARLAELVEQYVAMIRSPGCFGYPNCDGTLEGEPHVEGCPGEGRQQRYQAVHDALLSFDLSGGSQT